MAAFKHLLDGEYSPFTNVISFVEIDVNKAIETFQNWTNKELLIQKINGELSENISLLTPASYPQKYLFIQTDSKWTAIFKNNLRGLLKFKALNI